MQHKHEHMHSPYKKKATLNIHEYLLCLKALSHGAIFLATCNAILLLVDVKLANTRFHHSLLIPVYS